MLTGENYPGYYDENEPFSNWIQGLLHRREFLPGTLYHQNNSGLVIKKVHEHPITIMVLSKHLQVVTSIVMFIDINKCFSLLSSVNFLSWAEECLIHKLSTSQKL